MNGRPAPATAAPATAAPNPNRAVARPPPPRRRGCHSPAPAPLYVPTQSGGGQQQPVDRLAPWGRALRPVPSTEWPPSPAASKP
eukprot:SAG11_NODE_11132_length_782_cov_0.938507_1_plen_83_part_10